MPVDLTSNNMLLKNSTNNYVSLTDLFNNTNSANEYIQEIHFTHGKVDINMVKGKYSPVITDLKVQAYAFVPCQKGDILKKINNDYEYRYGIYDNNDNDFKWFSVSGWTDNQELVLNWTSRNNNSQDSKGILLLIIRNKNTDSDNLFYYINCYEVNNYFYLQLKNPETKISLPSTPNDTNGYLESVVFYGNRKVSHGDARKRYSGDFRSEAFRIPGIEITNNNVLLCTSEARYALGANDSSFASDETAADITIARSFDYGKTWIDKKIIFKPSDEDVASVPNTRYRVGALLCDRVTNRVYVFSTKIHQPSKITTIFTDNTKTQYDTTLVYRYSDDDGETWSEENSLENLVRASYMASLLPAVGKGINLSNGCLVVPLRYYSLDHPNQSSDTYQCAVVLLYSMDHGATWDVSQSTVNLKDHPGFVMIDESSIIEYQSNKILINGKTGNGTTRRCFELHPFDKVQGKWIWNKQIPWEFNTTVTDFLIPLDISESLPDIGVEGCMDIVNYLGSTIYLMSNQATTKAAATVQINNKLVTQRKYLTFKYSLDCLNWTKVFMPKLTKPEYGENGNNFGYSNMTTKDGMIYYVYEDAGNINFIKFPVSLMLSLSSITNVQVGE